MGKARKLERVDPIEFLWLGLYAFAGFSLEIILGLTINLLKLPPLTKGINSILTGLLWFICSILLIQISKNKFEFNPLAKKNQPKKQEILLVLFLMAIIIITTFYGFNGFKPFVEFNDGSKKNIFTYLSQVFYYLGESSLIVLCIAFGQRFFEKKFSVNRMFPSGGVFLAITWGVMHIFLQGISGGLFSIFFSILAGTIYVVFKKDLRWSYVCIALAFII